MRLAKKPVWREWWRRVQTTVALFPIMTMDYPKVPRTCMEKPTRHTTSGRIMPA